jgi:iron complex outermembrane recepter protein
MRKTQFNRMLALASTMALVSGSQAVYAQESAGQVEEITVTGFRASLQNSIAAKQESSSVVEAIYAEDIGKLPDTSIAESLARLPGLAGERRDGRTSGISVRGFNENYVATTMNGRELLGIGDNRGVEYDLYPSEIISGATVYKTPDASMMTQGLGGIVELKTIRPLDSQQILSINGSYEQNGLKSANPDFDDNGHRIAFTYADKFADDTIGAAISIASMESPSQEEQFRAWGDTSWASATVDGQNIAVLGGHDSYVRSSLMERDTMAGVLQFEPNDKVSLTLDALYIDFNDSKVFRGLEEAVAWGAPNNTFGDIENGLATSGTFSGFHSVIRNDGETKDAKLTTFGLNGKYQMTDSWSLTLDAATGNSEKDLLNMESYSGVGRAGSDTQGGAAARSYVLTSKGVKFGAHPSIAMPDYSDPANIRLAGPQAWGGGIAPAFGGRNNQQDGFVNNPSFEEDLDTLRLQADGEIEFAIFKKLSVGINYSDRSKSKVNYGAYLTAPDYFAADGVTIDGGDGPIPENFIVGVADLGFLGLGNIVAYDGIGLYKSGYYSELSAGLYQTDRLGDSYKVNEEATTLFVKSDLEYSIMTGNLGVQFVDTDQSASGFDTQTGEDGTVDWIPVTDGDSYSKVLPSMNLNFQLADDHVLRVAAAKTISRARMDDMKPNNTIGFNFDDAHRLSDDPDFSAWSGKSGNARLKPIEANQYDISYEYYFADDGYMSAAYFYKDLTTWHVENRVLTDFTSYIVPGYHDANLPDGETLVSTSGYTTSKAEAGDGYAKGYEVQISLPFHLLSDSLDGLGMIASGSFLDGEIDFNNTKGAIPGLSKETYQLTVYYERGGFEFRVSGRKRDKFLTEFPGLSLALTPTTDLGSELWDAQIGYDFSDSSITSLDGLTITLQAQNLTDEDTKLAVGGDSRQIIKYQHFGANYLLGFNYKF